MSLGSVPIPCRFLRRWTFYSTVIVGVAAVMLLILALFGIQRPLEPAWVVLALAISAGAGAGFATIEQCGRR